MNPIARRAFSALFACAAAAPFSASAAGQYGSDPIKLVVPFPPGGGTDTVARVLAENLRVATGWNLVIDNKAGAGGNIGMDAVAKARADGSTLGMGQTANLAINPSLYPKMPYDAHKDFVPVAVVARQPVVLVVRADAPYKTVAELVTAAKSNAGKLTMASAGNGTVGHLTGELFARQAGFQHVHVPYKGAGPATTDLLGGQVAYYFGTPEAVSAFIKAGKLRALAVSSAKRLPILPDTPTIAEAGYKGFETGDWKMLVAPAGTPADIVARVNAEVNKSLSKPETIARLLAVGSLPGGGTTQQAAQLLLVEQQRWGAVVKAAGIKAE
jgi:tripartite-type tricarboxylate transporter receptor subunit TctC